MFSEFLSQVKADYSWYSKSKNPFTFTMRLMLHPYFMLLFVFRILTNFSRGGVMLLPLLVFYKILSWFCQIELPLTVKLGKGATFVHLGPRTFHDNAIIGEYCEFYPCCLIGGQRGKGTPILGNHIFMGYGSKIIGKVVVEDYVFVCPNSVVVKDVGTNSVVSGIPAEIINKKGKANVFLYDQTNSFI